VSAYEVMWANYFECVTEQVERLNSPFPQKYGIYVLLQYQSADNAIINDLFEQVLFDALQQGMLLDALVAQSVREAEHFWQIRDGVAEIIPLLNPLIAFDISVPINLMSAFVTEVEEDLEANFPGTQLLLFGHIGDGNLHLAVRLQQEEQEKAICDLVYQRVGRYRGAVSAEHGIGKAKTAYLHLSRDHEEIALMKQLKTLLDPNQILNRGRIF